jgi:ABC-type Co2+ transport system permease subunit
MTTLPLWTWVAGVVLLGLIIAYGIVRTGRRSRQEKTTTNAATKDLYKQEDRSN